MENKNKVTGFEVFKGNEHKLSLNYLLLTETNRQERYISFRQCNKYQGRAIVENYYKPVLLTNYESE